MKIGWAGVDRVVQGSLDEGVVYQLRAGKRKGTRL
jgi:hypothetical protein